MAARVPIKTISSESLLLDKLPRTTRDAFLYCTKLSWLDPHLWYLAGGTALALQVGHRESVDLDFFTSQPTFQETNLERDLLSTNQWVTSLREKGTVYGTLMGAKMSFIAYPFFIPYSTILQCGMVRILPPSDIAAMKIIIISQRGRKRDFIDLYWCCTHMQESLERLVERALEQYPGEGHNIPHIIKSLAYFDDAEEDPMPKLFVKLEWGTIKKYFQREAAALAKKILNLP
jgi:hypothetical protein